MTEEERDSTFYVEISEEASVPEGDAPRLVSEFLATISGFVNEEAWEVLIDLAPSDIDMERDEVKPHDDSIKDFLVEVSDADLVATARAPLHARVVAEALRSRADRSHLEKLQETIENEGLLALFELSRGELTETEMPTAGKQAQSGDLE